MTLFWTACMAGFAIANALCLRTAARAYHDREWLAFGFAANAAFMAATGFLLISFKISGWPS